MSSFGNRLAVWDGQTVTLQTWRGQVDSNNLVLLEQGYRDSFRMMGHVVKNLEETVPSVTL